MGLIYAASAKELLQLRNKIFVDVGIPILEKKGFKRSMFSTSWFGRSEYGYTYELCRLLQNSELQILEVQISRSDKWIKIFLNIFQLRPSITNLDELRNVDGMKYGLPPNNISMMRIKSDDIDGPPILSADYMYRNHKIKRYFTKAGLLKRVATLGKIIEVDLNNIDYYVARWHELYKPNVTTWDGQPIQ